MNDVIKINNPQILDKLRDKCVNIINRIKLAREKELADYQPPKWYTWLALDTKGHKSTYEWEIRNAYGLQYKVCSNLLLEMRFKTTITIKKEDLKYIELDTILNNF